MKRIIIICLVLFISCSNLIVPLSAATQYTVSPCNTSGKRYANAKVDIGYDSSKIKRQYYAYTNSYKQLTKVTADTLILQAKNEANIDGRYCKDEAKVPGVESNTLDEGHIIADSLGGVSNAYNITPQDSKVNRSGDQYKMEEVIRTALQNRKKVTNFKAEIHYPNNNTQIPDKYSYTFKINGVTKNYSFKNGTQKNTTTTIEKDYGTCANRKAAGLTTPIYKTNPAYSYYRDSDNDGYVCES